ncbi:NAD-dependent epimerase [Actinoplanes italicus]|uniref:Nucleoside-diphosphate-sugar epimerase n=1 Tax=Actinoplanes italicus TaxID=113567 RepID=A0A2T0KFB3_9ACTN|nr:NAD(P)-dependent oxidoreductase [Actinoplanes italicus]PRX22066.1 nucleoside-diphosphate-sugar epimerase [Actinoplanes italicus]GIE29517.1 NAD-dependent epimerase [Actinoplanes italicus]
MRMTAVVTGSSGRVGSAAVAALRDAGWDARGFDRVGGPATTLVGDLRDPRARRAALTGCDIVVHAAALHAPHVGSVGDALFQAVNVDATEALLDEARRAGLRRIVYISSTSVYGHALVPTDRAVWVDERLQPRPRDIYDHTKLAAERLVASAGIPSVTLRIARCFPEPLPLLAVHLLHRAVGLPDVTAAIARVLDHDDVTGIFNIAGPYAFTRADTPALHHDAAALISERLPEIAAAFHDRNWALPSTIDRVYDSAAATEAFGYRPVHGVHDLLSQN